MDAHKQEYMLECSLHLSKKMFSHWPRRGHSFLQIHCSHWKVLELLWESGFEVTAVSLEENFMHTAPPQLQQVVDMHMLRAPALAHLPFANNSFDYVELNFLPPISAEENISTQHDFPPLHAMLSEALRVAAKGVIFQGLNPFSMAGMQAKCAKKSLPPFLQQSPWHAWRDVCNTLRTLAPTGKISTRSMLLGPIASWGKKSLTKKINEAVMLGPVGALMQVRFNFADGIPLTGTALKVGTALKRKEMQVIAERASSIKRIENSEENNS